MDLSEFVSKAARTDKISDPEEALRIGLMGIAGEAGSVISEAKKWFRDGKPMPALKSILTEELGDLLWYIALVARRLDIDLNRVADANLRKTEELWAPEPTALPTYDDHPYEREKFLRHVRVRFEEDRTGPLPKVRLIPLGELADRIYASKRKRQIGDDLDDNSAADDGYRYHDIIHLSHMTVLGWSPVLRGFMGAKRKSVGDLDRVQDGARAIAVEESLAAFVFNYMAQYDFDPRDISWELIRYIRWIVRGLEVEGQPVATWRNAYSQAFAMFSLLRQHGGGIVECDLDRRTLSFVGWGSHAQQGPNLTQSRIIENTGFS